MISDCAKKTFSIPCHNENRVIIARLLKTGGTNAYTILKKGQNKMIFVIGIKPGDLIVSRLILNLNEACKIDTSWIETGRYIGIWWQMHLRTHTWNMGPKQGFLYHHTCYIEIYCYLYKNSINLITYET